MNEVFLIPTIEELQKQASILPGIHPMEVVTMLRIMKAADHVRNDISDPVKKKYDVSEGKLRVLIVLRNAEEGIIPSLLAAKVGVSKATISNMIVRMERDQLVYTMPDKEDKRGKKVVLTEKGKDLLALVLPELYLHISKLIGRLTEEEQKELVRLLAKMVE